jgi:hypothetical protein
MPRAACRPAVVHALESPSLGHDSSLIIDNLGMLRIEHAVGFPNEISGVIDRKDRSKGGLMP